MRRGLWILLTPTLLLILALFLFDRYIAPSLIGFAINKVESISKKQGPVEVKISEARLTYLPIGLRAQKISLVPKGNLQTTLSNIEIQEVSVELAVFALLTGKLKIGNLNIESPELQVNLKSNGKSEPSPLPTWDLNWNQYLEPLELIPVEQVNVHNLNLKIMDKKSLKSVQFSPVEIQLLKLPELFQAKIAAPDIRPSWDPEQILKTSLQLAAIVTPQNLQINQLLIQNKTLDFNLSGQVKANKKNKKVSTQVHWRGHLNLDEFKQTLKLLLPDQKLPTLTGRLEAQGNWEPTPGHLLQSQFTIKTTDVGLEKFRLGNAEIKGKLNNSHLNFEKIQVDHPAGLVELSETEIELSQEFPIKTQLALKSLDFVNLFSSIRLSEVPIEGQAAGEAPCQGQISPFDLKCQFQVRLQDFSVRAGKSPTSHEIVAIEKISAAGQLQVNLDHLKYEAQLQMPRSKGTSTGAIVFKEGFKIQFSASELNWLDVKNLSHLSLEGLSQLTGSTSGNSRSARFDMTLSGQNQAIGGFYLGDVKTQLNYLDGWLDFPTLSSQIESTTLTAQMKIDLRHSQIQGQISSPQADLAHIQKILERPVPIPISMSGSGPVRAEFSGPLDFWNLKTRLSAQIQQPQLAGEMMSDLILEVESQDGVFNVNQLESKRNRTSLNLIGTIGPDKKMDLQGVLKNARLEESDILSRIGWPLSGDLNAQLKLSGRLDQPEMMLSGQIADMILDENQVPNSSFKMQIENSVAQAEGGFFGNQVQALIRWPVGGENEQVQLRFKSQAWDYTPWLSLFNAGAINEETQGRLTADVNLQSDSGSWKKLSGPIRFDDLSLTRQSLTLSNLAPITIKAQDGRFKTSNFVLKDQNNGLLELQLDDSSLDSLNLGLQATTDLKLIQIFVPMFEEISGQIQINANATGPISQPLTVGQMSLKNGYFKIKNFPHAFEKMSLQSTFSQTRVLFNEIQGQLGGGPLRGEGSLQFQGSGDIPVFVRAKAQDISLNIPNGVKTRGDVDISFTGRKFPYLLSANYKIKSTLVEMNFGSENSADSQRRNEYLPPSLKQQVAEPLDLDLQLSFDRPIQIKNSLMEAQATGQLSVKGSPSNPVLMGQLKSVKGSQFFFKDKPFQIQTANIQFLDPKQINPELFISAQTRVDIYDVNLLIQGTAKEPTIRLSSVPPLSDNDLTSLLALGVTSSRLAEVNSERQQEQTRNEVFAAAFQSTGLSKKVQSATGFNVQLSNSFDTTRNISVPKFTVSRKLSKKANATVSFPVTGDQKTPEGKIQYSLTDSISINGSYETRKFDQNTTNIEQRETPSILGLDLEFSREFK